MSGQNALMEVSDSTFTSMDVFWVGDCGVEYWTQQFWSTTNAVFRAANSDIAANVFVMRGVDGLTDIDGGTFAAFGAFGVLQSGNVFKIHNGGRMNTCTWEGLVYGASGASDNTFTVSGDGTYWDYGFELWSNNSGVVLGAISDSGGDVAGNRIVIEDGAEIKIGYLVAGNLNGYTAVDSKTEANRFEIRGAKATMPYGLTVGRGWFSGISVPGLSRDNGVFVGGMGGKSGLLDMLNGNISIGFADNWSDFARIEDNWFEAAAGGTVTNVNKLLVGQNGVAFITGNSVRLSGGAVWCAEMEIAPSNGFTPVVSADGNATGCVNVSGMAKFANPSHVWPVAEKGAPAGKHLILKAGTLTDVGNFQLAPGTDTSMWKLIHDDNSVWLRYSHPATIVVVR